MDSRRNVAAVIAALGVLVFAPITVGAATVTYKVFGSLIPVHSSEP
jgi:hypothetical protein